MWKSNGNLDITLIHPKINSEGRKPRQRDVWQHLLLIMTFFSFSCAQPVKQRVVLYNNILDWIEYEPCRCYYPIDTLHKEVHYRRYHLCQQGAEPLFVLCEIYATEKVKLNPLGIEIPRNSEGIGAHLTKNYIRSRAFTEACKDSIHGIVCGPKEDFSRNDHLFDNIPDSAWEEIEKVNRNLKSTEMIMFFYWTGMNPLENVDATQIGKTDSTTSNDLRTKDKSLREKE